MSGVEPLAPWAHPDLRCGVGISVCLEFGGDPVSHVVDFVSAGCDLLP